MTATAIDHDTRLETSPCTTARRLGSDSRGRDHSPCATSTLRDRSELTTDPVRQPTSCASTAQQNRVDGGRGAFTGLGIEPPVPAAGRGTGVTVHGQCHDNGALECSDSTGTLTSRIEHFRTHCACVEEQHYRYRWDELNRLVDGLRYDRATGGSWTYGARMRYRYDGAYQRTVKQSFAATDLNTPERYALYVYPGDFERRGLTVGFGTAGPTYLAATGTADATETQYLIAGARIVWDGEPGITGPGIDRNRRATVNASDLLGTTAASIDLESGALLEVSTYYPNGARENLWADAANVPLEPIGFTTKEADEEIGVTYFGERWLIPRLGRWATPDPLHVHASGGGEALNSYPLCEWQSAAGEGPARPPSGSAWQSSYRSNLHRALSVSEPSRSRPITAGLCTHISQPQATAGRGDGAFVNARARRPVSRGCWRARRPRTRSDRGYSRARGDQ